MITIENLTYSIKGKMLINNVSADFESGKMHLILGPNGAGKSTMVKLISGEILPTKGNILFENINLHKVSLKEQAKQRAVLSQNIELTFPLSVQEVVLMGRYPHFEGKPNALDLKICNDSMTLFCVSEMKNRNYLTLSGGEKQRVQFARVFAQIWLPNPEKPRLLLLDEPLTFLDVFYQYDLMQKIKTFMMGNPDLTIIGVVHDINIAAKFADKVMLVKNGGIQNFGPVVEVLTEKNIYDVFKIVVKNNFEIE